MAKERRHSSFSWVLGLADAFVPLMPQVLERSAVCLSRNIETARNESCSTGGDKQSSQHGSVCCVKLCLLQLQHGVLLLMHDHWQM